MFPPGRLQDAAGVKLDMFSAQLHCQRQLHVEQHARQEGTRLAFFPAGVFFLESYIYVLSLFKACRHVTKE